MIQAYFSPGTDCLNAIKTYLDNAVTPLDIAEYCFTDSKIWEYLKAALARGVITRLLLDRQSSRRWSAIWIRFLIWQSYPNITVRISKTPGLMHNSFCVNGNHQVLTGSYNWTAVARKRNNENLILTDYGIAYTVYKAQFDYLWALNA